MSYNTDIDKRRGTEFPAPYIQEGIDYEIFCGHS